MVVAGRQLGTVTESVPSVRCGFATKPSAARMPLTSAMDGIDAAEALHLGDRETR